MAEELRRTNGDAVKFLLVRLDGIGDALVCVPMLEGLRRAYPDARFGAICSPANADVFSKRLNVIYVLGGDATVGSLAPRLHRAGYTHAIVATEEVAGYKLARASGASRRSGFWHQFEKPLKSLWQYAQLTDRVYRPAAWTSQPEHEVQTLYRLAMPFGAGARIPDNADDLRSWLRVGQTKTRRDARTALGFQVTAKLVSGDWGPVALAAMCDGAVRASGLAQAMLLVAPGDEGLAQAILEHLPSARRERTRLVPPATVSQWFDAIDALAGLVTPDSGAAHAAGMLGVPLIDLFEEARFGQLSRQWRPWAAPHRCIVKPPVHNADPARFGEQLGVSVAQLLPRDKRA